MRFGQLKRREFITFLAGAAVWPLAARAQQGERMRRIGVLNTLPANDPAGQERIGVFVQGLQQAGWTIGGNVRIDQRWAAGDAERIRKYAAELVAHHHRERAINDLICWGEWRDAKKTEPPRHPGDSEQGT